jgi:hypothetical protein
MSYKVVRRKEIGDAGTDNRGADYTISARKPFGENSGVDKETETRWFFSCTLRQICYRAEFASHALPTLDSTIQPQSCHVGRTDKALQDLVCLRDDTPVSALTRNNAAP